MDFKKILLTHDGRLNRKPFWLAYLALFVVSIVLNSIVNIVTGGVSVVIVNNVPQLSYSMLYIILSLIVVLVMLYPWLALSIKRLHDVNKSGWFSLIVLIPFGAVFLLILYCTRGTLGPNRFGSDPLAEERAQQAALVS